MVLAPMAGGPSTPRLAAAVCEAGGLGFLATGYLTVEAARDQIAELRSLTDRPFGVNVFSPPAPPADPALYEDYVEGVQSWAAARGLPAGAPRWTDDEYGAKLDLLAADPPAVVSFTFGCPEPGVVDRLRAAGADVWITVTAPEEARAAAAAGPDALFVQGAEAGGHRGSFVDRADLPLHDLLPLLELVRAEYDGRLVAAGGIAAAEAARRARAAGAAAVAAGTAFMLCPEAGTSPPHREALKAGGETSLTRAFSGRLARGIRNEFMADHDAAAPIAYPEIHYATAPLRAGARERGDASAINLWAGEAHHLAREVPAAEVVALLAA